MAWVIVAALGVGVLVTLALAASRHQPPEGVGCASEREALIRAQTAFQQIDSRYAPSIADLQRDDLIGPVRYYTVRSASGVAYRLLRSERGRSAHCRRY